MHPAVFFPHTKILLFLCIGISLFLFPQILPAASPFRASVSAAPESPEVAVLRINITIPKGSHVYADTVEIGFSDTLLATTQTYPAPIQFTDPLLGEERAAFDRDFVATYRVQHSNPQAAEFTVAYQGCDEKTCFPPVSLKYRLSPEGSVLQADTDTTATQPNTNAALAKFSQIKSGGGILNPKEFIAFLDAAENAQPADASNASIWLLFLLTFLGGLALNLTPCVLPMIPINLAIIGAEARNGSRLRGFALGGLYGLGMMLAYGSLGLLLILAGKPFGSIQSSPWFHFTIAAIFIALALAAFGVFHIDLTRFRPGSKQNALFKKSTYLLPLVMGAVSAVLSGACVTPVILTALLQAERLYAAGNPLGILLLFVLGAGMALPWPFAGAGLSFLPKPGRWMLRVNQAFGVFILLMAIVRIYDGVVILKQSTPAATALAQSTSEENPGGWFTSLPLALETAQKENKMVFIDFWASWCANCKAMDAQTFRHPDVVKRMDNYVKVKIRAERFDDPETKKLLDHFGIKGLPFYTVLKAK